MKQYILFFFFAAALASEILLNTSELYGFFMYCAITLAILIFLSKKEYLDSADKLIGVFVIMPITRIANLFLNIDIFWKTLVIYSILLFLVTYYSRTFWVSHKYTYRKLSWLPLIILIGAFLGLIGNSMLDFEKNFALIYLLPVIAYSEEVLFRGLLQNLIKKEYGLMFSIFITSLLYAVFTINFGFPAVLFFFLANIIICSFYFLTKNIFLVIIFNLIIHFFLFIV